MHVVLLCAHQWHEPLHKHLDGRLTPRSIMFLRPRLAVQLAVTTCVHPSMASSSVQVDVSQTGIVGSTLLAMFRKLGHPIKTVVSPVVMDAVKDRNVAATPLDWGTPQKGKVGNGQAVFYTVNITQEHLTQGFIIQVRLGSPCWKDTIVDSRRFATTTEGQKYLRQPVHVHSHRAGRTVPSSKRLKISAALRNKLQNRHVITC